MSEFVFITDRTQEDIDKVKSGVPELFYEYADRACLTRNTFWRWSEILNRLNWSTIPPTSNTKFITATQPGEISGAPEGIAVYGQNFAYQYWQGIKQIILEHPKEFESEDAPDLTNFPPNMDNLTFENVNVLERVMQYAIENRLAIPVG